jgi:hypothetical protein
MIIRSNYGEAERRQRGPELGAMEFLVKADPTPAHLSATTDRWTESRSQPPVNA